MNLLATSSQLTQSKNSDQFQQVLEYFGNGLLPDFAKNSRWRRASSSQKFCPLVRSTSTTKEAQNGQKPQASSPFPRSPILNYPIAKSSPNQRTRSPSVGTRSLIGDLCSQVGELCSRREEEERLRFLALVFGLLLFFSSRGSSGGFSSEGLEMFFVWKYFGYWLYDDFPFYSKCISLQVCLKSLLSLPALILCVF